MRFFFKDGRQSPGTFFETILSQSRILAEHRLSQVKYFFGRQNEQATLLKL